MSIRLDELPDDIRALVEERLRAEAQEEADVTPQEQMMMLSQIYYFLKDDSVLKMLAKDKRLEPLILGVSHLIRTSRLDNERSIAEAKLRWRRAVRLQLLVLPEESKMSDLATFDVLVNFGNTVIEDQRKGWRGKLAAERVKTWKIEGPMKARKKILGIF